jgi:four helix bundle protein
MHTLEELVVYNLSQNFSDRVWSVVGQSENFPKFGFGKQITNAADSISSNLLKDMDVFLLKRI